MSFFTGIPVPANYLDLLIDVFVLIILLLCSSFISAAEAVYFSLKPDDIRLLKSNNSNNAKKALRLHANPEKLLSTILITNKILHIGFIFLAATLSYKLFSNQEQLALFMLAMAAATFLLILAGETFPRIFASRNKIAAALSMAPFLTLAEILLNPLTSLLTHSPLYIQRRIETKSFTSGDGSEFGRNPVVNEDEKILKGIENFGNTNVSAIMVPRIDVTAIEIRSSFDKIIPVIINSGFSRIPVYSGSFDSVRGILYAKDVLPFANNQANFKWQSLLRPSYFVPETKKINDLLKEFQVRKIHMAIVIDEYGGTSGIVTLEDILEEIVGDITDETDEEETMFRRIDETKFIFEGKILLNDFCRVFNIDEEIFAEVRGESETLAGLMLELAGEIPQKDHVLKYKDFIFRIESVDKRRIREILVERLNEINETEK